ncbi:MAG: hypothetical protein VXY16_03275 [Pseudomonadota bacterium]|nr:hypothetical protein [Pseudomonadota bacterium]
MKSEKEIINTEIKAAYEARDRSGAPIPDNEHFEYWASKKYWTTKEAALLMLSLYEHDCEDYPPANYAYEIMEHEIARAITNEEIKTAKHDPRFGHMIPPANFIKWAKMQGDEIVFLALPLWGAENTKSRGRPSSLKELKNEIKRRVKSGDICEDWNEECKYLAQCSHNFSAGPYALDSIKNKYLKSEHLLNVKNSNKNKSLRRKH